MKNKVVLVTGASRGIGAEVAKKFGLNGYFVAVNYCKSKAEADKVAKFITENGGKAKTYKFDVSNYAEATKAVEKIEKELGPIDVLVNNAGIYAEKPFEEKTIADFEKTFSVNLFAMFNLCQKVGELMFARKKGNIVNVSSTSAFSFNPLSVDYDASKASVIALTKNLAINYQPYVRCNSVSPGWVDTDINKNLNEDFIKQSSEEIFLHRWGRPEEIANIVWFLTSDQASFINGTDIIANGGEN